MFATTIWSAPSPNTRRRAWISAAALPPRAGVNVSWETKTVSGAIAARVTPRASACRTTSSMTPPMWLTSSRDPWNALLAVTAPSTSQIGVTPRSRAAAALSTTMPIAPIPRIIPWRRTSNGSAASSTTSSVAAAPDARKPEPTQGISVSEVTSSAATTSTRRQRPARIQSSASEIACVVLAHAELIWVFGPRAPISSAICECPIESTRKRKRRSKWYGCSSSTRSSSPIRRSTSSHATPASIRDRTSRSSASRSRLTRSAQNASMSATKSPTPGNADAKITPVSSCSESASRQRSGSLVPRVVSL